MAELALLIFQLVVLFASASSLVSAAHDVVYAVNCGGGRHTDRFGIQYEPDNQPDAPGIASDFGKSLIISRVHPSDAILYQTERYHTSTLSYDVPILGDGSYVLVLKFAEVYFQYPGGKVFDVTLNRQHTVISNLDIFSKVGKAAPLDEAIPFAVENDKLVVNGEISDFDGTLTVDFVKGIADNPKINAILVVKGSMDDPDLPVLGKVEADQQELPGSSTGSDPDDAEIMEALSQQQQQQKSQFKKVSGPKLQDPYSSDESWFMPITCAIAVFLPILFCLCRVR